MGRILSIRLSAVTFNTEDVFRAWPHLCFLAWPGKGDISGGSWKPKAVPATLVPPVAAEPPRYGVRELAHELLEEFRFGEWDAKLKDAAKDGMEALDKACEALDSALADWKPQIANTASDAIEDALDKLERELAYTK